MRTISASVALALISTICVSAQTKEGTWRDTTKDNQGGIFLSSGSGKLLLTEDYEVMKTHEVCGSLTGYFLEKSNAGRYDVSFNGMRTSARFVFTTQYDAEKWVEKWCTSQSLTGITAGHGTFARNY